MAVGGGGASPASRQPRPSAGEVSFDLDAPSNSSLAFEPAEVMTFTLLHTTPSKTFQLLSIVNLHPTSTTFFSVKTLKPERYFIKPSKCMLGPREHILVRIELRQALYDEVIVHFSHEHKLVTDRLLIQSGFNTNPVHESTFQAALRFKNDPKSKEKDAAWSAAWKTLPSSQLHSKNLVMRFEASPDFGKVPQTIDTSTATTIALRGTVARQPAVSDPPPLFTTHESTFSIEEAGYDIPVTQHPSPLPQRRPSPSSRPAHVPAQWTAPPLVHADSTASRKSSVGKREKSGLSLALVPSTESLVFAVSPHKSTSHSTLLIENLAPQQRVCYTVRIESKFRCKALPFRVGYIDGAGTASVQLELAMSLHQEIYQQLAQAEDIEPYKLRLQVMEMDAVTAAAAAALPTEDARAQFLKALWQSPPKRMFVQKYVAAFVLDMTPAPVTAVAPAPVADAAADDDDDGFGGAERLSAVSECASYATAFTRAPPMRPIMTPLEHLQYQRSLNRHLLSQNGTNETAGPLRATILELTEADELFAQRENERQAKKDQYQPEPEPAVECLIDPEVQRRTVVASQPTVDKVLPATHVAQPSVPTPTQVSRPILPTAAPVVVKSHQPVQPPTVAKTAVPLTPMAPTKPSHPIQVQAAPVTPPVEPTVPKVVVVSAAATSTDTPVVPEAPAVAAPVTSVPLQTNRPSVSLAALPPLASTPLRVASEVPRPVPAPPTEHTVIRPAPVEQPTPPSAVEEIAARSVRSGSTTAQPVVNHVPAAPARARSAVASSYLAAVSSVVTTPSVAAPVEHSVVVTPPAVAAAVVAAPSAAVDTAVVASASAPSVVAVAPAAVPAAIVDTPSASVVIAAPAAPVAVALAPSAADAAVVTPDAVLDAAAPATVVSTALVQDTTPSVVVNAVIEPAAPVVAEPTTTPVVDDVVVDLTSQGAALPQPSLADPSPAPVAVSVDVAVAGDPTLSSTSLQLSEGSLRPSTTSDEDAAFLTLRPSASMDMNTPLVDAALASLGLDPIIESQEGSFLVSNSITGSAHRPSATPEVFDAHYDVDNSDDDDSDDDDDESSQDHSQDQDDSQGSDGAEEYHEEIDEDDHVENESSEEDSGHSDEDEMEDTFPEEIDPVQPARESHDEFEPRPSTIDDLPSGFSILTFSDSQPTRSPEKAVAPAMDWIYDERQQAFVETIVAPSSPQVVVSPPASPRASSMVSLSANDSFTLPPPLVTNSDTPLASPEPSPPPPSARKSKSRFSLLKAFERNHGPSKPVGLVTLTPQTILYHMDVGSQPKGKVTLTNLTSSLVVYKVKSAQPTRYKVKPSQGFIEPHGQVVVAIDLHDEAYDELICLTNMELGDIRDCLLVETVKGPSSRSAKALRNAKTHGELLGVLRALWSSVDKKEVNASRLFCEYSFDDSAYQSFTATLDGPAVPLVDEPKTPPAAKKAKGFGWKRNKSTKVLRNAL